MKTCNDCLHVDECEKCTELSGFSRENPVDCKVFIDRERFVELPCKVGDEVWCIKRYSRGYQVVNGRVNELYFTEGMQLGISVYHVTKGQWGKKIFATRKEAEEAFEKMKEAKQ